MFQRCSEGINSTLKWFSGSLEGLGSTLKWLIIALEGLNSTLKWFSGSLEGLGSTLKWLIVLWRVSVVIQSGSGVHWRGSVVL